MRKNIKSVVAITLLFLSSLSIFSQKLDMQGSWEGKLMITPEMGLRLVINIQEPQGDQRVITMDSPDQGAYGIPMQVNYLSSDSLNVAVPQLMFKYNGVLSGDSIKGQFSQGNLNLPLVLRQKLNLRNRPQTPKPPYPYQTEEVAFQSSQDNANLYGTLTLPDNYSESTPVVLLVSGSGTQNRDEELFEHKPFAVIADYLARNGIASLRYDDRGFDQSKGLPPNTTTQENAMDALGGIKFLKAKGFSKIGIIGHSEGGLIADKVANLCDLVDFIIELGGPSVTGDKILIYQNKNILSQKGLPEETISMYIEGMKGLFASQKEVNPKPFKEEEYEIFSVENQREPEIAALAKNLKENFTELTPWLRYFINYDPLDDIKQISVPILMIYGERDTQVPPSINVPILEKNISGINVKVYPELNHLLQHCKTGSFTEYAEIEETISPEVLKDIKDFILNLQ